MNIFEALHWFCLFQYNNFFVVVLENPKLGIVPYRWYKVKNRGRNCFPHCAGCNTANYAAALHHCKGNLLTHGHPGIICRLAAVCFPPLLTSRLKTLKHYQPSCGTCHLLDFVPLITRQLLEEMAP